MREYGGNGSVAPCIFKVEISRTTILDALEKKKSFVLPGNRTPIRQSFDS